MTGGLGRVVVELLLVLSLFVSLTVEHGRRGRSFGRLERVQLSLFQELLHQLVGVYLIGRIELGRNVLLHGLRVQLFLRRLLRSAFASVSTLLLFQHPLLEEDLPFHFF